MPPLKVSDAQVAAFRLTRHHLRDTASTIESICSDVCGVQAQIASCAELALWTRRRRTTRLEIRDALWQKRSLVKTSLMRMTLHLVPATEYATYISALRDRRMGVVRRLHARLRIRPAEVESMIAKVMAALSDGPRSQQELVAIVHRDASRQMRFLLKYAWSAFRPAIVDGLICYGPPRGGEITYVRVDRWLPPQPAIDPDEARAAIARRFLRAYGPADVRDLSKWSGLTMPDAKKTWASLEQDLVDVSVDGTRSWILRDDAPALADSRLDESGVRLLPSFDPLLLAHAQKDHLVEKRYYKQVYRNQGWLSPVILAGGRIAGTWSPRETAKRTVVDVDLFGRAARQIRKGIEEDVAALGAFLGTPCTVSWSRP